MNGVFPDQFEKRLLFVGHFKLKIFKFIFYYKESMQSMNSSSQAVAEMVQEGLVRVERDDSVFEGEIQEILGMVSQEGQDFYEQIKQIRTQDISSSDMCIICYNMQVSIFEEPLVCGHVFHPECIKKWLKFQSVCPYCQQPVTNLQ